MFTLYVEMRSNYPAKVGVAVYDDEESALGDLLKWWHEGDGSEEKSFTLADDEGRAVWTVFRREGLPNVAHFVGEEGERLYYISPETHHVHDLGKPSKTYYDLAGLSAR